MSIGVGFGAILVEHPDFWNPAILGIYVLVVVGTRPEAIKMAPVIHRLREEPGAHVVDDLVRGLVLGIFGAFAAGGVVIGAAKTFATSLGAGEAAFYLLFGVIFMGLAVGIGLGPMIIRDLSRRRAIESQDRRPWKPAGSGRGGRVEWRPWRMSSE